MFLCERLFCPIDYTLCNAFIRRDHNNGYIKKYFCALNNLAADIKMFFKKINKAC